MDHFEELHGMVASAFQVLDESKQKDDRSEFIQQLKDILPDARRYITDRLNAAEKNGRLAPGKYDVEKIIDELSHRVFDHFHEVDHKDDLRAWLITKADLVFEQSVSNVT